MDVRNGPATAPRGGDWQQAAKGRDQGSNGEPVGVPTGSSSRSLSRWSVRTPGIPDDSGPREPFCLSGERVQTSPDTHPARTPVRQNQQPVAHATSNKGTSAARPAAHPSDGQAGDGSARPLPSDPRPGLPTWLPAARLHGGSRSTAHGRSLPPGTPKAIKGNGKLIASVMSTYRLTVERALKPLSSPLQTLSHFPIGKIRMVSWQAHS